jgi:methyltransferase (TIGR00027 family)
MEEKQAGITALITAYARAYHATHDSQLIFNDFRIAQIYTPEERIYFDQQLAGMLKMIAPQLEAQHPDPATALAWVMQLHLGPITLSRSRYCEDCLDEAIRRGVRQYVILGAGFDTFAFRQPQVSNLLQVFEVDHPVTQTLKQQRISAAGWQIPDNLHFIPVNFSHQDLAEALKKSAYDPKQLTFFSWLGVSYYLTKEEIEKTLQSLSQIAPRGSTVLFDYLDRDAFDPDKVSRSVRLMQEIARQVGEPMKAGFAPDELGEFLQYLGMALTEDLSPTEIAECYFKRRTDHYRAFEHIHFARALIK